MGIFLGFLVGLTKQILNILRLTGSIVAAICLLAFVAGVYHPVFRAELSRTLKDADIFPQALEAGKTL